MKNKHFKFISLFSVLLGVLSTLLGGAVMAGAVAGVSGGTVDPNAINTVAFANEHDPDLRLNHVERKVVKIFPQGTPFAQLAMYCKKVDVKSQTYEYRTASLLPRTTEIKTKIAESSNSEQLAVETNNNGIFAQNETVRFKGVKGYEDGGKNKSAICDLMAIVVDIDSSGKPIMKPVNGKESGGKLIFPDVPVDTLLIRQAKAHNEVDIESSKFASVPSKKTQYLQKMATQIEQSTLDAINAELSESEWDFSDMEEMAINDMRFGQDATYLFGVKGKTMVGKGQEQEEVLTCEGAWYQAGVDFLYGNGSGDNKWTSDQIVDLHKVAFTGGTGSKKKVMLAGSEFLASITKATMPDGYNANIGMYERFNLTFSELKSNFGIILVVLDEALDASGMADSALVVDTDYMRKAQIGGIGTVDLELRKSGKRDVDARVIRDVSAVILQNPNAHIRVTPKP